MNQKFTAYVWTAVFFSAGGVLLDYYDNWAGWILVFLGLLSARQLHVVTSDIISSKIYVIGVSMPILGLFLSNTMSLQPPISSLIMGITFPIFVASIMRFISAFR